MMKDTELLLLSQERYKFLENPKGYILNLHKYDLDKPIKKWYETKNHYNKRLTEYNKLKKLNDAAIKKEIEKYTQPMYIHYKGQKLEVPNDFYISYCSADTEAYLNYLYEEDCKKNIVTDEDREKARLLDCNLDYNYLQEIINKINKNPDLNVTIKTKDGATIHINAIPKQEDKDDLAAFKELFVEVPKVK